MRFVGKVVWVLKKPTHKGRGAEGEARASGQARQEGLPIPLGQGGPVTHVHERSVDVVATLPVDGDEEGQAAVRRQDVHAAVLLVVPRQQRDAAVFHAQCRRHHVQGLQDSTQTRGHEHAALHVTFTLRQIQLSSADDGVPAPLSPAPPPILSALFSPAGFCPQAVPITKRATVDLEESVPSGLIRAGHLGAWEEEVGYNLT